MVGLRSFKESHLEPEVWRSICLSYVFLIAMFAALIGVFDSKYEEGFIHKTSVTIESSSDHSILLK